MDDIFKQAEDLQKEEKINKLFNSSPEELVKNLRKEEIKKEIFNEEKNKEKNHGGRIFFVLLSLLLIFGSLAAAGYFWWKFQEVSADLKAILAEQDTQPTVQKVREIADLPQSVPVFANLTGEEDFSQDDFFTDIQSGDKFLIYAQAQRAVLYRPETNEILATAPFLIGSEAAEKEELEKNSSSEENEESLVGKKIETKVKVSVLNGTEIKGLAKETADKLTGTENVEVAKIGNAQKSDYTKVLVVDLSGKNELAAKILAEKVGGEVGLLPMGETKETADILIIAGKP